jgi:NAD+ synthase (glutamine-hydrolysing)
VSGVFLPGPFSSELSRTLAEDQARLLAIEFAEVSIDAAYESILAAWGHQLKVSGFSLVHENLQARLRAVYLMAHSNRYDSLLLNTSNKSELAMGFSTLYGDHCGGLSPIGDLLKTQVFELARRHYEEGLLPRGVLDRAPSAELGPNQKDSDRLPPYPDLDKVLRHLVEQHGDPHTDLERRVFKTLMATEFKRWQSPPVLKVSDHGFGRGRRYPIAHQYR